MNSSTNSIIVSNGTIIWVYLPYENMVMISDETQMDFVQEPLIYANFIDNVLDTGISDAEFEFDIPEGVRVIGG